MTQLLNKITLRIKRVTEARSLQHQTFKLTYILTGRDRNINEISKSTLRRSLCVLFITSKLSTIEHLTRFSRLNHDIAGATSSVSGDGKTTKYHSSLDYSKFKTGIVTKPMAMAIWRIVGA